MTVLIGLIIGLVLGLTGAGGSVLALPLLTGALQLPLHEAVALSLAAVALAAVLGVLTRLHHGDIQVRPALVMIAAGAVLAPLGIWIRQQLPDALVLAAFALVVGVVALRLWRQASAHPQDSQVIRAVASDSPPSQPACAGEGFWRGSCALRLGLGGALTGVLSGLFGVGGGFVIVPVLRLVLDLGMREAVATSLLVIAAVSSSGFFSSLSADAITSTPPLLWLSGGAAGGMLLGTLLGRKIAGASLQRLFAVIMVVAGGWSLWQGIAGL